MLGPDGDERLPRGQSALQIVARGSDPSLVQRLRQLAWPAKPITASGLAGSVTVISWCLPTPVHQLSAARPSRLRRVLDTCSRCAGPAERPTGLPTAGPTDSRVRSIP